MPTNQTLELARPYQLSVFHVRSVDDTVFVELLIGFFVDLWICDGEKLVQQKASPLDPSISWPGHSLFGVNPLRISRGIQYLSPYPSGPSRGMKLTNLSWQQPYSNLLMWQSAARLDSSARASIHGIRHSTFTAIWCKSSGRHRPAQASAIPFSLSPPIIVCG
jgi:hypothetical protein